MLTYIGITIKNDQYRGGIEIQSIAKKSSIGSVRNIRVWRREVGRASSNEIYNKSIASLDDLNFTLFDILAISGKSYVYAIDIMTTNTVIETQVFDAVACWFEGLFIGDYNEQYMAGSNFSVDARRNTVKEYVTTLSGKYPYAVSNADTNYSSGSAKGLFLKLTSDKKKFIPDTDHSYSTSILDFITNGTSKILKTHDGQAWLVSIDEDSASPYNDHFTGMNQITFNWTEVGDLPAFGMVVE